MLKSFVTGLKRVRMQQQPGLCFLLSNFFKKLMSEFSYRKSKTLSHGRTSSFPWCKHVKQQPDTFFFTCLTSVIAAVVWSCASSWCFVPVVWGDSGVTGRNDAWEFQQIFKQVWEQWQSDAGEKAVYLWTRCGVPACQQKLNQLYKSLLIRGWF